MSDALTSLLNSGVTLAHGGLKIEESVLLPPGWVHASQDDGLNTYTGPLSKMPVNPKFSKLKLPRDLYDALFGKTDRELRRRRIREL